MQKKFIINIFIYIIALKLKSRIINISGLVCCETRLTLFFILTLLQYFMRKIEEQPTTFCIFVTKDYYNEDSTYKRLALR